DVSGEAYGGGKTRKLELLLADAVRAKCTRVVTSGGAGSNQAVATAAYGRALGLEVEVLLLPQPPSDHVRENLLAAHAFGASLVAVASNEAIERAEREATGAYVIPTGGSTPLGNVAFVSAGFELAAQVRAGEMPEPDVIFIPLGTMGSAAGLAIG